MFQEELKNIHKKEEPKIKSTHDITIKTSDKLENINVDLQSLDFKVAIKFINFPDFIFNDNMPKKDKKKLIVCVTHHISDTRTQEEVDYSFRQSNFLQKMPFSFMFQK